MLWKYTTKEVQTQNIEWHSIFIYSFVCYKLDFECIISNIKVCTKYSNLSGCYFIHIAYLGSLWEYMHFLTVSKWSKSYFSWWKWIRRRETCDSKNNWYCFLILWVQITMNNHVANSVVSFFFSRDMKSNLKAISLRNNKYLFYCWNFF